MNKDHLRVPGIVFVIMGVLFLLGASSGITGFVVGGESDRAFGFWLSGFFIVMGIVILISGGRMYHKNVRERENIHLSRKEIRDIALTEYRIRNGRAPTNNELDKYSRELTENGEIYDIVANKRKRERAA